jgi:hypothetical protein
MGISSEAKMTLHLHVKREYFNQIKSGEKREEYRRTTPYWQKFLWKRVLAENPLETILIYDGYPKKGDTSRILTREWKGYAIKTITHPHFGPDPVEVFAIRVND